MDLHQTMPPDPNHTGFEPTRKPVLNPFLPLSEYIPDGEPHVFGERVYLFGSHDEEGGDTYCALDYVFYSAPIDDLSKWTSKGVNYRASQDPSYGPGRRYMFAPDVVRGNDGRYYLYYGMSGDKGRGGYSGPISVAVSDEPDGNYEYLGVVRHRTGLAFTDYVMFDPALINDSGVIRLYFGACHPFDDLPAITRPFTRRMQAAIFDRPVKAIKAQPGGIQGALTVQLADDMMTVISSPSRIVPTRTKGTSFEGHAFFEASSIRKIGETYYFVYSSTNSHELCYATSSHPDHGFVFRGTMVSNGDVGYNGRRPKDRVAQTGSNHGSIEQIGGRWYVFYHRNTHGSLWSRQACAEEVTILPDGSIPQVELTSSGLNGAPLPARGEYPAAICCHLTNGNMPHGAAKKRTPRITFDGTDRYVQWITNGTKVGYKHFSFDLPVRLTIHTRGPGQGYLALSTEDGSAGSIAIQPSDSWTAGSTTINLTGTHALFLRFVGTGDIDLLNIAFD
ncbi:family 43 glycosylhydrolase [Pseudarthrobacter sp. NPDC058329]|uniref:family 43 glycosylhydrolase n=1 Tax=Pseudarthrobacter sp. NPDC058329 TaxID=3346448 RepID=UPI0036DC598B